MRNYEERRRVTFLLSDVEWGRHDEREPAFSIEREVRGLDSVDKVARDLAAETGWRTTDLDYLVLHLRSAEGDAVPVDIGLRDDWEVHFPRRPRLAVEHILFADLWALSEAGLLTGDPDVVIVRQLMGYGGDPGQIVADLSAWLLEAGVDIGIGAAGAGAYSLLQRFGRYVRLSRADRRAREAAARWRSNNLTTPAELRQFVDRPAEWGDIELAKRLALSNEAARQLLIQLGYERLGSGAYRRGTSKRAQRKRARWERLERRIETP